MRCTVDQDLACAIITLGLLHAQDVVGKAICTRAEPAQRLIEAAEFRAQIDLGKAITEVARHGLRIAGVEQADAAVGDAEDR